MNTAKSIDTARVIRRSVRCFHFGMIGLLPIVGAGLAGQAIRIFGRVLLDLEEEWQKPKIVPYWIAAFVYLPCYDILFGPGGGFSIAFIFLALQTYRLWRSLPQADSAHWNPAQRQLRCGLLFGYAGLFVSLMVVEWIAIHIVMVVP